jgi:hypothetical protein
MLRITKAKSRGLAELAHLTHFGIQRIYNATLLRPGSSRTIYVPLEGTLASQVHSLKSSTASTSTCPTYLHAMSAATPSIVHGPTARPQTAVDQEQVCSLSECSRISQSMRSLSAGSTAPCETGTLTCETTIPQTARRERRLSTSTTISSFKT